MKKIACVYTGLGGLTNAMEALFPAAIGEPVEFNHILDSGLIRDVIAANGLTPALEKRVVDLLDCGVQTGADLVVCTCSSIGDVCDRFARENPDAVVLRIDYPMAKLAVEQSSRIALMATLETTVTPSCDLVKRIAKEQGKSVDVYSKVAEGAFAAIMAGEQEKAAAIILQTAKELSKQADVLLLAQASMGAFAKQIEEETGLTVYTSPATCADYIRDYYNK